MESHIISLLSMVWGLPAVIAFVMIGDVLSAGKIPIYAYILLAFSISAGAAMITRSWANSIDRESLREIISDEIAKMTKEP